MKLFLRILAKIGLLQRINFHIKLKSNLVIPVTGGIGSINILHDSEKRMSDLLMILFEWKSGTFIDVGVNLGQTLIKVKHVDRNKEYLGFDPNFKCINYVHQLTIANEFEGVALYPIAISSTSTFIGLNHQSSDQTDSQASIIEGFRKTTNAKLNAYSVALDSLIGDLEKVGIIKIDVEGAESLVIEGSKELITRDRPIIICEVLPVYTSTNYDRLERQNKMESFLKIIDYKVFRVLIDNKSCLQSFEEIQEIGIHSDLHKCNYLFVPDEMSDKLLKWFR